MIKKKNHNLYFLTDWNNPSALPADCFSLRFFFFYFKNQPQNTCQQFRTFKNNNFHNILPFPAMVLYLKKNSIDTPNPIKTTADKKSKNCAEQNIDKKMIQPNPIAIMQGGLLGFLPFPQFFINVLTCQRSISVLIFHYTPNAEIVWQCFFVIFR